MAKDNGSGSGDELAAVVLVGMGAVAAVVVFFIPAVLALTVFLCARRWLSTREYLVLLLGGILGWAVGASSHVHTYWMWLSSLRHGLTLSGFPWLAAGLTAAVFVGVLGLVSGSRISERMPRLLRSTVDTSPGSILPSQSQKDQLSSVVAAPGGVVSPPIAAPDQAAEPGQRLFPIGVDPAGAQVRLSESEIRTHAMILGSTGSGKTESIKVMAGGLLDLGWEGMVLDLKEDAAPGGLRDWCETYAAAHHRPYQELRLSVTSSDTWFNPLFGMGPDEIRDTILALQDFDDAYWQALNKELLGQAVNLMLWAHQADPAQFPAPTMYDLGKMMSSGDLKEATRRMRAVVTTTVPGVVADDFRALANPSQAMQQSATGYGSKLTLLYDTQAGRIVLRPDPTGHRRLIDVTANGLTYIGLDSQGKADLTKMISSAVLQRMSVYAAARVTGQAGHSADRPRFLIVDEANWVNRTIVQNLLSRARSAGIAMVLCTQGPKDWIDVQGDDWGKLTQNVNIAMIMSQGEPESAELCADYIGREYKQRRSETVRQQRGLMFLKPARDKQTGDLLESHSIREELAHKIDPDDLRRMGVGEAILRVGKPQERVTWMKVIRRDPSL